MEEQQQGLDFVKALSDSSTNTQEIDGRCKGQQHGWRNGRSLSCQEGEKPRQVCQGRIWTSGMCVQLESSKGPVKGLEIKNTLQGIVSVVRIQSKRTLDYSRMTAFDNVLRRARASPIVCRQDLIRTMLNDNRAT
jgi:hypothetical protein